MLTNLTSSFGIPQKFQDDFVTLANTKHYLRKIRGHDFLSYAGQCTNRKNEKATLQPSAVIFAETSELQRVSFLDGQNLNRTPELTVTFGPAPGSFLVDAPRLKLYQWSDLPRDLEEALQTLVCRYGYGDEQTKIQNVAVNSEGGWVLQGGKDHQVVWGGELSNDLVTVLKPLGKKKPHIKVIPTW